MTPACSYRASLDAIGVATAAVCEAAEASLRYSLAELARLLREVAAAMLARTSPMPAATLMAIDPMSRAARRLLMAAVPRPMPKMDAAIESRRPADGSGRYP